MWVCEECKTPVVQAFMSFGDLTCCQHCGSQIIYDEIDLKIDLDQTPN